MGNDQAKNKYFCPKHSEPHCVKGLPYRHKVDCRLCWLRTHDWRYRRLAGDVPLGSPKIPCRHLGDELGPTDRERLGLTHLKVWRECEKGHGPQCPCNKSCSSLCADYEADGVESVIETLRHEQNVAYPTVGVSIGSYGFPSIIELQAATIRANCGNIPIIVSDDRTEEAGADGLEKKARILDICEKYSLIFRDAGPGRIGHSGGDLGAYWHGLHYAKDNGIEYWLKLSQRFIVDRPLFIQKLAAMMKARDSHTMSNTHKNRGKFFFAIRSEFALMEVRRWSRPQILEQLRPRPIRRAAEDVVHGCVKQLGGAITSCPMFTADRAKAHAGLVWYEQPNAMDAYMLVANKYDVYIGTDFHIGGSHLSPNYQIG